jgi:hypothetical protein
LWPGLFLRPFDQFCPLFRGQARVATNPRVIGQRHFAGRSIIWHNGRGVNEPSGTKWRFGPHIFDEGLSFGFEENQGLAALRLYKV